LSNLPWLADPQLAFIATIVPTSGSFPFNSFFCTWNASEVPLEVYEAAKLDGASYWKQVSHITIPMLKPVTVAGVDAGNDLHSKVFDLVWIMTGGGPANSTHLLSTYAYQTGNFRFQFRTSGGHATVMVLLIVL